MPPTVAVPLVSFLPSEFRARSMNQDRDIDIDQGRTVLSQLNASELKVGERIAERYRIEALLGIGGMGVVYRAHDEQLSIDIALKLLRPELATRPEAFERFRQELLLARRVSSPHVVRIHDLVADGNRWLISMDYVPGHSLEQHLDAHAALPQQEALSIARQVALGLAAAHASGIIHRDLKPANILLQDDGHACISDFGVARSSSSVRMTQTGMMVGTPDYVSPEQARGDPVGPRSDLYALGLILYEMLSGRRAFDGATPAESLAQRLLRPPQPLRKVRPEIAPWVERLVTRLLDPRPLRRLRDAQAVVTAIDAQRIPQAPLRTGLLATTTTLALAVAGGVWWAHERGLMLSVQSTVVAAPPLDVAVLPLLAAATDADLARASDALLGASLLAGNLAVADLRRVDSTLIRLGYDASTAAQHPQRVLSDIGARRLLTGEIERDGERLRIALQLSEAGTDSPVRVARSQLVGAQAIAPALRGLLAELGLADASADLGTFWPSSEPALRAFGRALDAEKPEAALLAYAEAVSLEPRFVAAWWQRLQVARRLLPDKVMRAMTATAREALREVRGRDAERVLALIALIEGNPSLAAERFTPLAASDPHDHHTRLLLAEALEAAGKREAAAAELEQLTRSDPQNADTWLLLGQSAIRAGDAQRAVDDYLLRARVLFTRLRDERGRADTLNALGLGFDLLGQSEPAMDYFTQAAELREAQGNRRGAAGSRRNLAWVHAVANDTASAEAELARARALVAPLDDPELLADIANDAGLIDEERGDFRAALPHFREALALREAQGDASAVAESALNFGFALQQTGEFDDAQPHLEQAERTYIAAEDRVGIVRSTQALAAVDIAHGNYPQARARLQRALRLAEEVNLAEERAVMQIELAEVDRLQGRMGDALMRANQSLTRFEQRGDARGVTEARLRIAAVYRDLEDWDASDRALTVFVDALPGNREHQGLLAIHRSEIALGRGDAAKALQFASAALKHGATAHSLPVQAHAQLLHARALAVMGDNNAARAKLEQADAILRAYPALALQQERALVAVTALPPLEAAMAYRRAVQEFAANAPFGRDYLLHRAGAVALHAIDEIEEAVAAEALSARGRDALQASLSIGSASGQPPDSQIKALQDGGML